MRPVLTAHVNRRTLDGMSETLGRRLKRLREERGLTQAQLAETARVNLRSLQNWEIDHREPEARALVSLASALDVDPCELLDGTVAVTKQNRPVRPRPAAKPKRPRGRPRKPKE